MLKLIRDNPRALLIACAIHLVLIGFLSFSVSWHSEMPAPKQALVKSVLIDDAKLKAEQEKKRKADALKKKKADEKRRKLEKKKKQDAEEKRKAEQKKKKLAAEKKRKAEQIKKKIAAENKRKADAKRKKQEEEKKRLAEQERERKIAVEKKRKETEARRAEEQRLLQEQMAAEEARLAAIRQSALDAEKARYIELIKQKVDRNWIVPSGWRTGTKCDVNIRLVPGVGGGQVISVAVVRSCGHSLYDRSVEAAVNRASPLPLPNDPALWDTFRNITFGFSPGEN